MRRGGFVMQMSLLAADRVLGVEPAVVDALLCAPDGSLWRSHLPVIEASYEAGADVDFDLRGDEVVAFRLNGGPWVRFGVCPICGEKKGREP